MYGKVVNLHFGLVTVNHKPRWIIFDYTALRIDGPCWQIKGLLGRRVKQLMEVSLVEPMTAGDNMSDRKRQREPRT